MQHSRATVTDAALMADAPVIAYQGEIVRYTATKPERGSGLAT